MGDAWLCTWAWKEMPDGNEVWNVTSLNWTVAVLAARAAGADTSTRAIAEATAHRARCVVNPEYGSPLGGLHVAAWAAFSSLLRS